VHQHSGSRQPIDALAAECRAAFTRFRLAWLKANFRPDQLRDGAGRWTLVGGSRVVVTRNDRTGHERVDRTSDLLVDELREVSEAAGEGAGPNFGVAVHVEFASRVRELDLPGIGIHGVEQSFSAGDVVRYGLDGSIRTDVVLRSGRGDSGDIQAVWDVKTGTARLTEGRIREIREALGIGPEVPIIELHVRRGVTKKDRDEREFHLGTSISC
jgi:hypothetical protein